MTLDPSAADPARAAPPATPGVKPGASPQNPHRRWLRYSLRSLLVVMLLFALAAAWVGHHIQMGRDQLAAIEWVDAEGGSLQYKLSSGMWQQRWLGAWYPQPVTCVELSRTGVTNLDRLAPLTQMTVLRLRETPIEDLEPLAACRELRFLDLSGASVSEEQVDWLQAQLPELIVWRRQLPHELPRARWSVDLDGRTVRLLEPDGEQRWSIILRDDWPGALHMGAALIDAPYLFLGDYDSLYALDLETGNLDWKLPLNGTPRAVVGGTLLVSVIPADQETSPFVAGLEAATGEEQFRQDFPEGLTLASTRKGDDIFVLEFLPQEELMPVHGGSAFRTGPVAWTTQVLTSAGELLATRPERYEALQLCGENMLVAKQPDGNRRMVEVSCFDPATGAAGWTTVFGDAAIFKPNRWSRVQHEYFLCQRGEIVALIAEGTIPGNSDLVVLLDAETGMFLLRCDFQPEEE